ncbi:hypothetical protein TNCV_2174871 [Trichonephila clavipes]|nr:hypothetical protein TNCV_2174871 [Trichonephila clavipes]
MEPGGSGRVWAVVFECCSREKKTASVLPGLMEIFHLLYQSSSSARCLWRNCEEIVQSGENKSLSASLESTEGSVVGVESSKFVLPDLVLEGFDLPVYPVLNVVQHSLVARISRELPGFPGSVPLDHELSDFIRNVVGIPTPNRFGKRVCVLMIASVRSATCVSTSSPCAQ